METSPILQVGIERLFGLFMRIFRVQKLEQIGPGVNRLLVRRQNVLVDIGKHNTTQKIK